MNEETKTRLQRSAEWLVIAMPFLFVAGSGAADAALTFTGLMFLWHSWRRKSWGWVREPWFVMALALWAWLALATLDAENRASALGRALLWIRFPLFAVALQYWLASRQLLQRILVSGLLATTLVAADAIWQFFSGTDVLGRERIGDLRLTGPFSRPVVGIYLVKLSFVVMLPAFLLYWNRGLVARGLLAGWVLLVVSGVLLSGERTALFLLLLGLVVAAFCVPRGRRLPVFGVVAVMVLVMGLAIAQQPRLTMRLVNQTLPQILHYGDSPYGQLWRNALALASANPLTGVGPKNFREACDDDRIAIGPENEARCGTHPHNIYLEWLVEAGLIGLAGFLGLVFLWGRRLIVLAGGSWRRVCLLGGALSSFIQLWPFAPVMSFFTNWSAGLVWFALGITLAAAMSDPDRSGRANV